MRVAEKSQNIKSSEWLQTFITVSKAISDRKTDDLIKLALLKRLGYPGTLKTMQKFLAKQIQPEKPSSSNSSKSTNRKKRPKPDEEGPEMELRRQTWAAYAKAHAEQRGVPPIYNAKQYAHIKQICDRIGALAPEVMQFYLKHPNIKYVNAGHSLGMAVMNIEALAAEYKGGYRITTQKAREFEVSSENEEVLRRMRERLKKQEEGTK
jgi:hypothetical protein